MEAYRFPKLGAIPYQRTGAELRVGAAGAPAPVQAPYSDPTFFQQPILMQGTTPECGGYSLAFVLAYLLNQQQKLSGSFAYAFEKTIDGVPKIPGTTIKAIGEAAQSEGTCLDSLFPDDGGALNPEGIPTSFGEASVSAMKDALTRSGFVPLFLTDLSWNGLQAAISKYKTVIVEAQVGDEWYTAPDGTISWAATDVLPLRPPKKVTDDHFFALGGKFNALETWFANSWSPEWGANGFGYFGTNYVPYIKNAIVLYKPPASIQAIAGYSAMPQANKIVLIQQIIDDIEEAVGLFADEVGQL